MRVAIIGLGLIGASVCLALKSAAWQQARIVGYVRNPKTIAVAKSREIVDEVKLSIEETVEGADIVIISTPVLTIRDIFLQITPYLESSCVVTDTASTKAQVMLWAEELLPTGVSFVGGHPMAGKETSGIAAADGTLFHNCTYCLVPASRAKPTAAAIIGDMVKSMGANPLTMAAEEHDRLVAGISHLPLLLSAALVTVTAKDPSWQQMSQLAASGYRDLTRLASGNPEVNAHICLSNQSHIVSWIDQFITELQRLRGPIASGSIEIEKALEQACRARQRWLEKHWSKES